MVSEMKYKVINAVCETGNFTKAAEKLNYSQSAVSQAVRNFEKELGITLFERSKKGVKPLTEVLPIIESIQKIHDEEEKMKEYVKAINNAESGVIRIAYLGDRIENSFLELFRTFGEKYPKIRCEISKKAPCDVERDLENRLLDFAFSFTSDVKGYEFIPYGEEELLIFLPKGHRLASRETVSIQELKNENILVTSEDVALDIERIQEGIELRNQDSQFYFSEGSVALKFVEQGRGICVLPNAFANIGKYGLEVEVKSFEKKYYRTWGMYYPKSKNLTNVTRKFLNHVFDTYKK